MASSSEKTSTASAAEAVKKGFIRRMVPFFLAANLGVGAYVLVRTKMTKTAEEGVKDKEVPAAPLATTGSVIADKSVVQPAPTPVKVLPPIPEEEQRQLFKWILEEKRKLKTKDPAEKKRLDEEKALLKEFIRAKSLPSL